MELATQLRQAPAVVDVGPDVNFELNRPAYPLVPHGTQVAPKPDADLATKLVDAYVEADPRVVVARARHDELSHISDRLSLASVGPATLALIAGLTAASGGEFVVAGCCAVGVALGGYIASLHGRFWSAALDPAKAELEKTRLEVRKGLQGPNDLKSVAERLAAQALPNDA